MKVAILKDSIRTCINVGIYSELPEDTIEFQYQEVTYEFNVSPNCQYGWTDATKTTRCICGDCKYLDEKGILCTDVTKKREEVYNEKFNTIKEARKEIQFGWFNCDTSPDATGGHTHKNMYADASNRAVINNAVSSVILNSGQISIEFPEVLVKTETGAWYVIKEAEVAPMFNSLSITTQALYDTEYRVQQAITADYEDSSISLEDFEAIDYVTLATTGFNSVFEAKIADTTIYAQPTTEPTL